MKRGISQEGLKGIACLTMLVDHIGVILGSPVLLRLIGRISFPIYCFLLAEGVHHTRNPRGYALRLLLVGLLSELPFDLVIAGFPTWQHQSVMLTLLLGFFALQLMKRSGTLPAKLLTAIPFVLLAEWLCTDYGGWGVMMILLFGTTRDMPRKHLVQLTGLALLCCMMPTVSVRLGAWVQLPMELFALTAMIPICLYSGKKTTGSRAVQWGFYLFYPVHLAALYFLSNLF